MLILLGIYLISIMNDSIKKYIFEEIIPRYAAFDAAHREDHARTVMTQAMSLLDGLQPWLVRQKEADAVWYEPVDREMLMMASACHDLGLVNGRDNHHLDSGKIIRSDLRLREWFSEEQVEIIAQAAEDHRASGKSRPRSIYGMIVAEADRVIDTETIIRRTLQYGQKNYPLLDGEGHVTRAMDHLREKYGRNGYLKLWIPWSDNAVRLARLHDLIDDEDKLREKVSGIFSDMHF